GAELLGHVEERLVPDALPHALGDVRLGRAAELGPFTPDRGEDRRVRGLDHGDVALGVELSLLYQGPGDRIRRAAQSAGGDSPAPHEAGEVAAVRREALFGAEIDVAAVDAMHDGAKLGAFRLGERAMLGPADEGEGLAGQHRVGVAGAGLDGDDLYLDVGF